MTCFFIREKWRKIGEMGWQNYKNNFSHCTQLQISQNRTLANTTKWRFHWINQLEQLMTSTQTKNYRKLMTGAKDVSDNLTENMSFIFYSLPFSTAFSLCFQYDWNCLQCMSCPSLQILMYILFSNESKCDFHIIE